MIIGVLVKVASLLTSYLWILLTALRIRVSTVGASLYARWALTLAVIVQRLHIALEIVARVPHPVFILVALDMRSKAIILVLNAATCLILSDADRLTSCSRELLEQILALPIVLIVSKKVLFLIPTMTMLK